MGFWTLNSECEDHMRSCLKENGVMFTRLQYSFISFKLASWLTEDLDYLSGF